MLTAKLGFPPFGYIISDMAILGFLASSIVRVSQKMASGFPYHTIFVLEVVLNFRVMLSILMLFAS